ncbi:hypothetical protein BV898_06203 [Hypsibius exemplaris]|uniref:Uncharacterized protein n=1 Tax=Hypsibius exemplaris TaxID=2072580 RepID=A0A1W0WXQ2_HYPEX|nr:hypothetical protein BV898_06203 [Hypsibius exemplaris]
MQILPGEIPLSVIEKYLTLCQKIQWVASQMSFSFGLLYYVFRFATDVGVNPLLMVHVSGPFQGIGFFNGLFSMLVAGIGAALVAPRTTAPNWSRTRRTLSTIYAVASLLSLVSNIVQMGITAALASPTYGL